MVPEDFGTMTHWYSRTPEEFLEKLKPPFLPQATRTYSEKNGLVWDVRDAKWVDAYWSLIKTACDIYGQGKDQQLLHTIGLGERNCFKDRKENLKLKIYASIFLAYENALDIRANYPLIEERQKIVQDDPMCAGYILWPESSHTDTLALRFFTQNAWSAKPVSYEQVLNEFCKSRYGDEAPKMKAIWEKVVPLSYMSDWGNNYSYLFTRNSFGERQYAPTAKEDAEKWRERLFMAKSVYAALAEVDWRSEAIRRDTIDLARTVLDRQMIIEANDILENISKWRTGAQNGDKIIKAAERLANLADRMADLLELHTDYSLWESYERLTKVESVPNPNFPQVLLDNAANSYCQSHQYELARYWYAPRAHKWAEKISSIIRSGDPKAKLVLNDSKKVHSELLKRPLKSMRPTAKRTNEEFIKLMSELSQELCGSL